MNAFLQLSKEHGARYGSICATCRSEGRTLPGLKETDESTRSSTGKQIDQKAKMFDDIEKQIAHDEAEEDYHRERDEAELENTDLEESRLNKSSAEKKHRREFLDNENKRKQRERREKEKVAGSSEEIAESAKVDFGHGIQDLHRHGYQHRKGLDFQIFKKWAGFSHVSLDDKQKQVLNKAEKEVKHAEKNNESLKDYVERNTSPGSGRKR